MMIASELSSGIASFWKLLLEFASGNILETGVGTSNNIRFYWRENNPKVTGIDYS